MLKKRVAALAPLPLWVPTTDNRRFNGAMRTLQRPTSTTSSSRNAAPETTAPSFLTMLMDARDPETGSPMTDRQLHEEILGMLQQGHDTVGESLAWMWYLLSLHPEVERQAVRRGLARSSAIASPVVADLPRLTLREHGPAGVACACIRRCG